jgi:hypothetical protein
VRGLRPAVDHHVYVAVYFTVTLPSAGMSTSNATVPESSLVKSAEFPEIDQLIQR